jgi:hypothetical protein
MRRSQGGDRTFETIRSRYDTWAEDRPPRPVDYGEDWTPQRPEPGLSMGRMIPLAIGVGTGVLLLILAALSFWNAASWASYGREPATIGYTLTGCFLIVAGIGGILATLNHTLRVLDPNRDPAHGHH